MRRYRRLYRRTRYFPLEERSARRQGGSSAARRFARRRRYTAWPIARRRMARADAAASGGAELRPILGGACAAHSAHSGDIAFGVTRSRGDVRELAIDPTAASVTPKASATFGVTGGAPRFGNARPRPGADLRMPSWSSVVEQRTLVLGVTRGRARRCPSVDGIAFGERLVEPVETAVREKTDRAARPRSAKSVRFSSWLVAACATSTTRLRSPRSTSIHGASRGGSSPRTGELARSRPLRPRARRAGGGSEEVLSYARVSADHFSSR